MGSAVRLRPYAGGTGVSPGFGFITPFLARKGDGGMVERAVGHQRRTSRAETKPVAVARYPSARMASSVQARASTSGRSAEKIGKRRWRCSVNSP